MFTGLVEIMGRLTSSLEDAGGRRLSFEHDFAGLSLGESISVSGTCLTVVAFDAHTFTVQVSPETLQLTTLGRLVDGATVNLERALPAGARLGGHLVTGHVDGMGRVAQLRFEGEMCRLDVDIPENLRRYMAKKGSVTVEGVSLTVNDVTDTGIALLVIPHTRHVTSLGTLAVGDLINIEVDLVARYVERLLTESGTLQGPSTVSATRPPELL